MPELGKNHSNIKISIVELFSSPFIWLLLTLRIFNIESYIQILIINTENL